MKAEYIQRGETIYFTPETDVAAGDVVVIGGKRVAVAASDIKAGTEGVAHTVGVFAMPKGTGAIDQGADVYWDGSACTASRSGAAADSIAADDTADDTASDDTKTDDTASDDSASSGSVLVGYAFAAAAEKDETVAVKLLG